MLIKCRCTICHLGQKDPLIFHSSYMSVHKMETNLGIRLQINFKLLIIQIFQAIKYINRISRSYCGIIQKVNLNVALA